jgi:hypothetical protein
MYFPENNLKFDITQVCVMEGGETRKKRNK